ncbi:ribosomal protein S18-alanine N-acetyltransferase [Helcococcus sueciensis]|uniref:ribosomal protein S18-alanine N-acetyltransferase n=1 Tax=Helcococcus sueciensis TaxID=241555 RepID=UPI000429871B|nr:ribosomal protein S18-alanine N-acetyltransferase [Helcococcus sueciensis]
MENKYYRNLEEKDIDTLVEIEKFFPNPWPLEAFFIEFEGENNKTIGLEIDNKLIGYMFYNDYLDEININHFAIHPDFRRRGYASDIMNELISRMKKKQIIYLEVSTENLAAINLYKKFGLEILYTRKNYYGLGEDAYIMQRGKLQD